MTGFGDHYKQVKNIATAEINREQFAEFNIYKHK
jgi:hypothetical protein